MIAKVLISQIKVGDRRRDEMGDIAGLAKSIEKHGLLHPIVVDADHNLVAGERRLRAHEHLGRAWIEARQLGDLTDAELREIELEENLRRKDLTSYELSKTMVERIEVAREVAKSEFRTDSVQNPNGGRPQSPTSVRAIQERTGIPPATALDAERHVETADTYPVFQKPDWKQYHVLEAREALTKLPEPARANAVALIDQPGIPPKDALETLRNIVTMPEPKREEVFRLAESSDPRDRSLAVTTAAERPPMPDPRWTLFLGIADSFRKAARDFSDDPFTPRVLELAAMTKSLAEEIKEAR